ncbi:DUF3618 domain-containing protein [Fodinicola acaciae]|uniref:DUF3618 domain-containing protein n=1 Tax=Fodinicola acaciae TaxID=2681555 RepID=UPI0013CFF9EE|nr:DUF3618 domain-containing protein [Fodinicola acaciae]
MTSEQVRTETGSTAAPQVTGPVPPTEAELHADIARLRVELGGTVDQLAGRLDVRKQAEAKLAESRERLMEKAPVIGAAIGVGVLAIGALIVLRAGMKRRKKRSS